MNPDTININSRYYLQPRPLFADPPDSYDVIDRALEYNHRAAVVFSDGTEQECREWVERNCEEPVEHTPGPWTRDPGIHPRLAAVHSDSNSGFIIAEFYGTNSESNFALCKTTPKLLALLEQYHSSMPTKESGKLICEARGWVIQE